MAVKIQFSNDNKNNTPVFKAYNQYFESELQIPGVYFHSVTGTDFQRMAAICMEGAN